MTEVRSDQGVPQLVKELWDLVAAYARQETLEPFKGLARFVAFGLGGALALGIGLVSLLVGILRLLQTQTGSLFSGHLTPVPYVITLAAGIVVMALAARAIVSGRLGRTRG